MIESHVSMSEVYTRMSEAETCLPQTGIKCESRKSQKIPGCGL